MAYKVIVSPRAQKEIENAIDYYVLYSADAPKSFILYIEETYTLLGINPFFRVKYKNIRAIKIKKFPYSLFLSSIRIIIRFGYYHVSTTKEIQTKDQGVKT